MGRCSQVWKELDEEKGEHIERQCQKNTWKASKQYCIFHDPSPGKDSELFRKKIGEQLTNKDYNFRGYCFPMDWSFRNKKFDKNAYFEGATFQKGAYFEGATFQYNTFFHEVTFQGIANFFLATFQEVTFFYGATFQEAVFSGATFLGEANFSGATFLEDAVFNETIFQKYVIFANTVFKENIEFAPGCVENLDLINAKFLSTGSITTDLTKARFHRSYLGNIVFVDCEWPEKIYEEIHMKDKNVNLSCKQLETIYRNLKQNMQRHGDHVMTGRFFYREMEMRRKGVRTIGNRLWLEVYRLLAGYGEHPIRTAISSFLAILLFASLYWVTECLKYPEDIHTVFEKITSSLYFSFVTFTTLGLGDIHPVNNLGRSLVCCEAVIGAFLIALFVVVFARKMIR